jgi:hypothetical protein
MCRAHRFPIRLPAAFLAVVLLNHAVAGFGATADRGREDPLPTFSKLRRGMTQEQVRQIVGAPKQIARQIFYHRYREQWVYDTPIPIRLTFDCPRGQMPQLLLVKGFSEKIDP